MGYIHFTGRRGRVQLWRHEVLGLTVWEARLPGTEESRLARRRIFRGLDRLEEAGCRRLLSPCPQVPHYPLVHTRSLWQAVAAPLALAALRELGLELRKAVVALHGERMTRSYVRTCVLLAREVKALSLSLEREETFCWDLQRELGLPLVEGAGAVTLSFLPGVARPAYFPLGAEDPSVPGFRPFLPGLELPPDCPELPVLAALLEAGRLPLAEVQVLPPAPPEETAPLLPAPSGAALPPFPV
ncbi:MAG: hypothetical protein ACI3VN_02900 [Candidatus Onthomonas sp.]